MKFSLPADEAGNTQNENTAQAPVFSHRQTEGFAVAVLVFFVKNMYPSKTFRTRTRCFLNWESNLFSALYVICHLCISKGPVHLHQRQLSCFKINFVKIFKAHRWTCFLQTLEVPSKNSCYTEFKNTFVLVQEMTAIHAYSFIPKNPSTHSTRGTCLSSQQLPGAALVTPALSTSVDFLTSSGKPGSAFYGRRASTELSFI